MDPELIVYSILDRNIGHGMKSMFWVLQNHIHYTVKLLFM